MDSAMIKRVALIAVVASAVVWAAFHIGPVSRILVGAPRA